MIGAAGALGAMICAMAIREGVVPPTINLSAPDPECDLDYVPNVARRLPVRVAATNAFGFGGQNCVAVLTTPPASPLAQRPSRTDASRFFTSAWTTTATSRNQAR